MTSVCQHSTSRGFHHDGSLSHVLSVGEGAGDAVRLGEGGGSKGNEQRPRDGDARRACTWQEVPGSWPPLEVRPAGMLVLSLPSISLPTSVFSHLSNGVKNISLWQTDECQKEALVLNGV